MKKLAFVLVLTTVIVALAVGATYFARRDQMEARRQAVTVAWNQVDAMLQRRAEMVAPLAATVHPHSAQEREVFAELGQAEQSVHAAGAPAELIAANAQLDQALHRLFRLVESDADLRFNEKIFRLEEQLNVAQNRIAAARGRYDQAVQDYNALISEFPNTLFALWSGHAPLANYFAAPTPNSGVTSAGE